MTGVESYILTIGVWTATGLVSFESYGIVPGALPRDYPQFRGLAPFGTGSPAMSGPMVGPMASPMLGKMAGPMGLMAGPLAVGGLAVIRIRLLPDSGSPADAVLRVNCAKGKVPEDRPGDGVRLVITAGPEFDEQRGGGRA